jgi:hypothetical protein
MASSAHALDFTSRRSEDSMSVMQVTSGAFRMSDVMNPVSRIPAGDLSRLTVSTDGRLFWDDKPVVIRRRIQLTFWQKLGLLLVGFAALMIALSVALQATITAHDWMCGAKWVTGYCPKTVSASAAPTTLAPAPSQPQGELTGQSAPIELPN